MPADQKCIEAMYNYMLSFLGMVDNRMDMHVSEEFGDMAASLIGTNTAAELLSYWGDEVESRCGVEFDEAKAEEFKEKEMRKIYPMIQAMADDFGKTAAEVEEERARKEKEVEEKIYG